MPLSLCSLYIVSGSSVSGGGPVGICPDPERLSRLPGPLSLLTQYCYSLGRELKSFCTSRTTVPSSARAQRVTGSDGSGSAQLLLPPCCGKGPARWSEVTAPLLHLLGEKVEITAASAMAHYQGVRRETHRLAPGNQGPFMATEEGPGIQVET